MRGFVLGMSLVSVISMRRLLLDMRRLMLIICLGSPLQRARFVLGLSIECQSIAKERRSRIRALQLTGSALNFMAASVNFLS